MYTGEGYHRNTIVLPSVESVSKDTTGKLQQQLHQQQQQQQSISEQNEESNCQQSYQHTKNKVMIRPGRQIILSSVP